MKKIATFYSLCLAATVAIAQVPNPIASSQKAGVINIIPKETLSQNERAKLWENKSLDSEGYTRFLSNDRYVTLIQGFTKIPIYHKVNSTVEIDGFSLIGQIDEDANRKSFIYSDSTHQKMMITVWKYKDSGATINIPGEFVGNTFKEFPSMFSLAASSESNTSLWKAVVWNSDYFIEVYIEDVLSKGNIPIISYLSVRATVKNVARMYMK
jgi:hypothetical protein